MADFDGTDIKDEKGTEVLSIYLYTESKKKMKFFFYAFFFISNHLGVK